MSKLFAANLSERSPFNVVVDGVVKSPYTGYRSFIVLIRPSLLTTAVWCLNHFIELLQCNLSDRIRGLRFPSRLGYDVSQCSDYPRKVLFSLLRSSRSLAIFASSRQPDEAFYSHLNRSWDGIGHCKRLVVPNWLTCINWSALASVISSAERCVYCS